MEQNSIRIPNNGTFQIETRNNKRNRNSSGILNKRTAERNHHPRTNVPGQQQIKYNGQTSSTTRMPKLEGIQKI